MGTITHDISTSEMLELREMGFSNQEIADQLECAYITVLKRIGRQDGRMRKGGQKSSGGGKTGDVTRADTVNAEEAQAMLAVTDRTILLRGMVGKYTVSTAEQTVDMEAGGGNIRIQADKLHDMILELQAIERNINKINMGTEMW